MPINKEAPLTTEYAAFMSYSHASEGKLSPSLQNALHKIAKPWYRLRTMRIFRDKTSLSANPALWSSIERALQSSRYFLLLASPKSAHSPWVSKEIGWWQANRSPERFLIVLTDGELRWNNDAQDFDWSVTDALPDQLKGYFKEEPLYVDLRWAKDTKHMSLRHSKYRANVLDIAATLTGKPKDELDGEDVRQHRLTRLIATLTAVVIIVFGLAAEYQRRVAVEQADHAADLLGRRYVGDGLRFVEQGDIWGGLVWFAEALRDDANNPVRARLHRVRLGTYLRSLPRLLHMRYEDLPFNYIAYSNDGRRVVSASGMSYEDDGKKLGYAQVWDAATGNPMGKPLQHEGAVYAASFSPDGRFVVTASGDKTARVWVAETGEPVTQPLRHHGVVRRAFFSPDGTRILTAGEVARVWDARTGEPLSAPMGEPDRSIWHAVFSLDGKRVATAAVNSCMDDTGASSRVWDAETGEPVTNAFSHPGRWLDHLAFSPDGKLLATAGTDGEVRLIDTSSGEVVQKLVHGNRVSYVAFSSDQALLLTASWDGTAKTWRIASNKGSELHLTLTHGGKLKQAEFSPDDRFILTSSTDGTVLVWDSNSGAVLTPPLRHSRGGYRDVSGGFPCERPGAEFHAAFAPDGLHLVTAGWDGLMRYWELPPRVLDSITIGEPIPPQYENKYRLSPNGKWRLEWINTAVIRLWNVETGAPATAPVSYNGSVLTDFDPMSTWLAVGVDSIRSPGEAYLRNLETGTMRSLDLEHLGPIKHLAFSTDGRRLLTVIGSDMWQKGFSIWKPEKEIADVQEGGVRLWDTGSLNPSTALFAKEVVPQSAYFTKDGNRVVVMGLNGVGIWDANTGNLTSPVFRNSSPLDVAWDSNRRRLVTGDSRGMVRVWDIDSGDAVTPPLRLVHQLENRNSGVTWVSFSADGHMVVAAGSDGSVRLWHADTGLPITPVLRYSGAIEAGFRSRVNHPQLRQNDHILELRVNDGSRYQWDISPAPSSTADIERLVQMLAMRKVDLTGNMVVLSPEAIRTLFDELRATAPELMQPTNRTLDDWHKAEFLRASKGLQWTNALAHLHGFESGYPKPERLSLLKARIHVRKGNYQAAIPEYSKAISFLGASRQLLVERGYAFLYAGHWDLAAKDYAHAVQIGESSENALGTHAVLNLFAGDRQGYKRACELLTRGRSFDSGYPIWLKTMEVLLLDPQGSPDADKLVTAVETGMKYYKEDRYLRSRYNTLVGPALYRADRFREAVEKLSNEVSRKHAKPDTLFFLAMAQRHLGDKKAAMGSLQEGLSLLEQAQNRNAKEETLSLYQWRILYKEARTVVNE